MSRFTKETINGANHISETAMDNYKADIDVINNGSLDELKKVAQDTVKDLKELFGGN